MKRYNPKEIEPKWQQQWEKSGIYQATEDSSKPKRYVLEYFPYPSGAAMHVGHVRNYTIGDVITRFHRMQGENVLHPMGWDSFGLPAENYAIKNNISPKQAIAENTGKFKQQLTQMGFSYDWSREIDSSYPEYYKWTQWFFKLLFDRGLAYQKDSLQWWCETDKTVLANEQVEAGKCWRCGNPVTKKPLKQWFFKITDYADRLVDDLEKLDWSDSIKAMQRNWIGKSKGAEIDFKLAKSGDVIRVFTTRPDTLFGATFMVLAPEHELVAKITTNEQKSAVETYVKQAQAKSDIERQETNREKTGVFTGAYAVNPVNNEEIPVWIADYVLTGYGTGAIMAVPAHDERDNEFAKKFNLPIRQVIARHFELDIKDDVETLTRDVVDLIVEHPTNGTFLLQREKDVDGPDHVHFVGGGTDGETDEIAIARELEEETGFQNFDVVKLITTSTCHAYRHTKNKNQYITGNFYHIKLKDLQQVESEIDEGKHTIEWRNKDEIINLITWDGHADAWNVFTNGSMYSGEGTMINSGVYDGMSSSDAREQIVADLSDEPLFVEDTVKEDQPFVERQAITAIIKHWSENKYLGLRWKQVDWETFLTGGVDEGQTPEQAAIREIQEETGYQNPKLVKDLGRNHAKFFHVPKDENRFAHFQCLYFELADGERTAIDEEESAIHEVVWLTKEELESFRLPDSHRQVWNKLKSNEQSQPVAKAVSNYKIRDWLISRQRYWGAPIPIIHCEKDGAVVVPEDQLPVELPELTNFQPTGEGSALAGATDWINTTCPKCGGPAKRETDTMDGFACSSWYFLRFTDPHNNEEPFSKEKAKFWMPVDDYIGGAEHAVMHLLYARMWTKVMFDEGLIDFDEPFKSLRNHGMILAPDGRKMSKSWGNVIAPDEIIEQGYGADAIRLMELFIGPWNQEAAWSVEGMGGCFRFLQRVWGIAQEFLESADSSESEGKQPELTAATHKTIKKVTEDLKDMGFNTAIAALMGFTNDLYKIKAESGFSDKEAWTFALTSFVKLLAPFAPHIAEELWQDLGNKDSVHTANWPTWDDTYLVSDTVKVVAQVNGKVRATVEVAADSTEEAVIEAAQKNEKVATYLGNNPVKKTIYVPQKLVNFVV